MKWKRRELLQMAAAMGTAAPVLSAAAAPRRPTSPGAVWAQAELYFGTRKPDGAEVTGEEFSRFLELEVTERFPDGLTLLNGYGQFRNSRGELIRENSYLLILLFPVQMQDANKRIDDIRERYKTAFSQESVLRVDSYAFVSF